MDEVWKDIYGYEGLYQVSNLGRVKSLIKHNGTNERILKPRMNNCGYLEVCLCKDGKQKMHLVHRLVAQAFIENDDLFKTQINHIDENKTNNFVFVNEDGSVDLSQSNLEWCDSQYNHNYGTRNERVAKSNRINGFYQKLVEMYGKQVNQYSFDGTLIKTWKSTHEIEKELGFANQNISKCCNGGYFDNRRNKFVNITQYHGFIWRYAKKEES